MNKIDKLYTASSSFEEFKDRKHVEVEWYKAETKWEDLDYSQLVENYHLLDETEKSMAEEIVNEYFTEEEIEILRDFFNKRIQEDVLLVKEHSIPIRVKDFNTGKKYTSLIDMSHDENTICLKCCFKGDYDLPFRICGYYNLDYHCPADNLPEDHVENGLEFLEKALAVALPEVDCSQIFTSELVNDIYEKHGLYVDVNVDKISLEAA